MSFYKVWYINPEYDTYRLIEINGIVLKETFLKRRLKKFKRRRSYLFLNFKKENKRESERRVEEDLSSNNSRDELNDLIKEVKVIKRIKVKGEVPARLIIQLLNIISQ
jgi:hypothetical protein